MTAAPLQPAVAKTALSKLPGKQPEDYSFHVPHRFLSQVRAARTTSRIHLQLSCRYNGPIADVHPQVARTNASRTVVTARVPQLDYLTHGMMQNDTVQHDDHDHGDHSHNGHDHD